MYAARTSGDTGFLKAIRDAIPEKALKPRINALPTGVRPPSQSAKGSFLSSGMGKAAVLSTTQCSMRSDRGAAQPKPIMPPQSCTTRESGVSSPMVAETSASTSLMRRAR